MAKLFGPRPAKKRDSIDGKRARDKTLSFGERSIAAQRAAASYALPAFAEDPNDRRGQAGRAVARRFERLHPGSLAEAMAIEVSHGSAGAFMTPWPRETRAVGAIRRRIDPLRADQARAREAAAALLALLAPRSRRRK